MPAEEEERTYQKPDPNEAPYVQTVTIPRHVVEEMATLLSDVLQFDELSVGQCNDCIAMRSIAGKILEENPAIL